MKCKTFEDLQTVLDLRLKSSSSLLCGNWLCDSLGASVSLVNLGVFSKCSGLQVTTVEVVDGCLHNDRFGATEVLVDVGNDLGLLGLCVTLGCGLGEKLCTVFVINQNVNCLGVGKTTVLEHVERFQVTRLSAEGDLAAALGVAVLLVEEGMVPLDEFPAKLIRNGHHCFFVF